MTDFPFSVKTVIENEKTKRAEGVVIPHVHFRSKLGRPLLRLGSKTISAAPC